jgi:serine/threonine-protein kinase LATS1/2
MLKRLTSPTKTETQTPPNEAISNSPNTIENNQPSSSDAFSVETFERSAAAKIFFEQYFDSLVRNPSNRNKKRFNMEKELENMGIPEAEKRQIRHEWLKKESGKMRRLRQKINVQNFEVIKTIGRLVLNQ